MTDLILKIILLVEKTDIPPLGAHCSHFIAEICEDRDPKVYSSKQFPLRILSDDQIVEESVPRTPFLHRLEELLRSEDSNLSYSSFLTTLTYANECSFCFGIQT